MLPWGQKLHRGQGHHRDQLIPAKSSEEGQRQLTQVNYKEVILRIHNVTTKDQQSGGGLIPHDQALRGHRSVLGVQQVQGVHAHQQVQKIPAFQAHPKELNREVNSLHEDRIKFCHPHRLCVYSQLVQPDQGIHALHADLTCLHYRAVQQYLGVQGYH